MRLRLTHFFLAFLLVLLALATDAGATETEANGLRVLPTSGAVTIDGKADDWNLAAGVFICPDVEQERDRLGVWFHAMYDENYLYILGRFLDDTPLNSSRDPNFDFGWNGDCLQVRLTTDHEGPKQTYTQITCWQGLGGKHVVDMAREYGKDGWKGKDLESLGQAKQAMTINADRKGYIQEVAISWKTLAPDGVAPKAGDTIRISVQAWWSGGQWGVQIADIFQSNVTLDKIFHFYGQKIWGTGTLLPVGPPGATIAPTPVRLADGREFPVRMEKGVPVVDWTGVVKPHELQGFEEITFKAPDDGYVSLNIKNKDGQVVRQLLTANYFAKGKHTIKWDGLTTPNWRTPGSAVEPGEYRWDAIFHKGIGLKWRGYACSSPTADPWDAGPGTGWGGDMGDPAACASEGDTVLLGWHGAEAGKAAVAVDLEGKVRWRHKRGGIGGASLVALDRGIAYIADGSAVIYKVRAIEGTVEMWTASNYGERNVTEFLPEMKGVAGSVSGMAAHDGKLYLSYPLRQFVKADFRDWRAVFEKLSKQGDPLSQRVWKALSETQNIAGNPGRGMVSERIANFLKDPKSDENSLLHHGWSRDVRDQATDAINALLNGPVLVVMDESPLPGKMQLNNRREIERWLGDLVSKAAEPGIAVVDGKSGSLIKFTSYAGVGVLAAVSDSLLYVIVDGRAVYPIDPMTGRYALDPLTGKTAILTNHLDAARGLAVDQDGNIFVSDGKSNQVHVFAPNGNQLRTIGRPGGRAGTGPWNPDGMLAPAGLAIDYHGKLWVMESDLFPRRISVWDAKTGKFEREFFGGTHYGASGGAINPRDPNLMIGQGCEWRIDPATGQSKILSVFDRTNIHSFARFCEGSNGRQYLAVTIPHLFQGSTTVGVKIFERLPSGEYKLRSTIFTTHSDSFAVSPEAGNGNNTIFWSDKNDDQKFQPEEAQSFPEFLTMGGYYMWSMYLNPDLSLTAGASPSMAQRGNAHGVKISVNGFTECGAPIYDVAKPTMLPTPAAHGLLSPDGKLLAEMSESIGQIRCFDMVSGKLKWSYPNLWLGVHASHVAPPPETGLIRGSFGFIGSATLPAPAKAVWCINTNCGEWHLLTADGFYLSRLFQPDALKIRWPKKAIPGADMTEAASGLGGEDFGGSFQQGADGKIYIEAGKVAFWNLEVTGVDTIKQIKGDTIDIDKGGVAQANRFREKYAQALRGRPKYEAKKMTPTLTGDAVKDFTGAVWADFKKQDDAAAKAAMVWDEANVYLAWQVSDATPMVNGASSAEYMYLGGDSVDFQLGTDPAAAKDRSEAGAGDLRLSFAELKGVPTAVLYRRISAVKKPMKFSSGVVKNYTMEFVAVLPEAVIKVSRAAKGYSVEAAVPLASLAATFTPGMKLSGDFGVTHGDPAGQRTRLRTYWSNQETGLVDDAVYELMMTPKNWGEILISAGK